MRQLLLTAALCAALGCATARPIRPGADPALREGEGLLVLDLVTDMAISRLECSGVTAAQDVPPGEHLLLLALPAGSYRWNRVTFPALQGLRGRLMLEIPHEASWSFRVEAGRISYPGQLVFRGGGLLWSTLRMEARSINRSSMAFQRLEKVHPELLGRLPIRYTGGRRDDFLERYSDAVAAGRSAAAASAAP